MAAVLRGGPLIVGLIASGCLAASADTPTDDAVPAEAEIRTVRVTYPIVERLIRDERPTSLEEFLPLLPPGYRENFTLVHTSASLQQGSFTDPRVILFGTDGKLLMSFNNDPVHRGARTLEVFAFDDEAQKFDTHRIHFYRPDYEAGVVPLVADAVYEETNPVICQGCHGREPRPIFATYSTWPGFYGESDDEIALEGEEEHLDEYEAFLTHSRRRGLYRFLRFPEGSPVTPYSRRIANPNFTFRPNLRLGKFTTRLTARVLARRIAAYPDAFVVESLAYLLNSTCRFAALSLTVRDHIRALIEEKFSSVVESERAARFRMRTERGGAADEPLGRTERWAASRLLYVAGVLPSDWSTSAGSADEYVSFEGSHSIRSFVAYELWRRLAMKYSELSEHVTYDDYGSPGTIEGQFQRTLFNPVGLPLDDETANGGCRPLSGRIAKLLDEP
jgi:hypothetical protein